MTFSDTEMMELGRKHPTNIHNTRSLIRTLKYVLDILQTEEASTVEEYKHTYTHTHPAAIIFTYVSKKLNLRKNKVTNSKDEHLRNSLVIV